MKLKINSVYKYKFEVKVKTIIYRVKINKIKC